MARTLRLVLEYLGTHFHGWQGNPDVRTVQETLQQALVRFCREPGLRVQGASRTDAGVHAEGQVAAFSTDTSIPPRAFVHGLNAMLPDDLAVWQSHEEGPDFHPRHGARGKSYRYVILQRQVRSPLHRHTSWHLREALDVEAMAEAALALVGPHDFSAFRASGCDAPHARREMLRVSVRRDPIRQAVIVEVVGTAFLKYMVRNMVGTLVQVGLGRRAPAWVAGVLAERDRTLAGPTAPAHGLTLVEVFYDRTRAEQA